MKRIEYVSRKLLDRYLEVRDRRISRLQDLQKEQWKRIKELEERLERLSQVIMILDRSVVPTKKIKG